MGMGIITWIGSTNDQTEGTWIRRGAGAERIEKVKQTLRWTLRHWKTIADFWELELRIENWALKTENTERRQAELRRRR